MGTRTPALILFWLVWANAASHEQASNASVPEEGARVVPTESDTPHWLPEDLKEYDGFTDALQAAFPDQHSPQTQVMVGRIKQWHKKTDAMGLPKAAIFVLAKDIHCGSQCMVKKDGCTHLKSIGNLARSLETNVFSKYPYPLIIFHEDWNEPDLQQIADAAPSTLVVWHRINMGAGALPTYLDTQGRDHVIRAFKAVHKNGNFSLPGKDGTGFHGFGYRMMCRFFSGLIHHAPLLREMDYYMRLDGGDSRLDTVNKDPFALLRDNKAIYGYFDEPKRHGRANASPPPSLALRHCINIFLEKHQNYAPKFDSSRLKSYPLPDSHKEVKHIQACALSHAGHVAPSLPLNLHQCGDYPTKQKGTIKLLESYKHPTNPFFAYNNFEVRE